MTTSRNCSERAALAAVAVAAALSLSACSSVTGAIDSAVKTASGKITDVKQAAQNVTKPIIDTANDVQKRIDQVGSGVTKLRQGIEQVKGAINAK